MAGAINSIGEILRYVNINIFKKYRNGIHLLEAIEEENVFDRPIDDDTRSKWSLLYLFDSTNQEEIITNEAWPGEIGQLKTNTVLQYDPKFETVDLWGAPALSKRPHRRKKKVIEAQPVELFKLHLGDMPAKLKPKLELDYKKAITDYLKEIGRWMKDTITTRWCGIDFKNDVLLIITMPAAEAAAVYCLKNVLKEHSLQVSGTTFMIVDCGGGTVDLTTYKLWKEDQLGEITERAGDFCGSTFVDNKFVDYLSSIVSKNAINLLKKNHYGQFQYMVQTFCKQVKFPFSGQDPDFTYELDIEDVCPVLKQYVTDSVEEQLEETEWIIEIDYDTIKSFFDPVIDRIISMIDVQLKNSNNNITAMFLVGGFSQSKYLQKRIKDKFIPQVPNISVPVRSIVAVCRGATLYGLSMYNNDNLNSNNNFKFVIDSRVLRYSYGIIGYPMWKEGDPPHRRDSDGRMRKFIQMAPRGKVVKINEESSTTFVPISAENESIRFEIYHSKNNDEIYSDEPGMKKLGELIISLPDKHLGTNRPVLFSLCFGKMEITARAINQLNGLNCETKFRLEFD
ncbi:23252_t:CDS:2 [Entrophospora sp. SA101]|nr:23252_t:CDS:2 [Entrophospora sp. SA101]